jgi:glycosyltransferase involved in cell wall biosynthesis
MKPAKHGSLEDFVCRLSLEAGTKGFEIAFYFENGICPEVETLFRLHGVRYHLGNMTFPTYYLTLLKALLTYRPDAVHLHFSRFTVPSVLLCKLFRVKKLYQTDHDSGSYAQSKGVLELLKRWKRDVTYFLVDKIVAVSKFVEKRLVLGARIPRETVVTIYNGVDTARFRPYENREELKARLVGTTDCKLVVYVGHLILEKGVGVLVEALAEVMRLDKSVIALLAGEGGMKEAFSARVQAMNLDRRIVFLGVRNDTPELYNAADVVVCPSIWEEAFGLVNAEAMACGVPIVATSIGGIPEIVRHMETGFLVPAGNPKALADALVKVLSTKELRLLLGTGALKAATSEFSLERMASDYVQLYCS